MQFRLQAFQPTQVTHYGLYILANIIWMFMSQPNRGPWLRTNKVMLKKFYLSD